MAKRQIWLAWHFWRPGGRLKFPVLPSTVAAVQGSNLSGRLPWKSQMRIFPNCGCRWRRKHEPLRVLYSRRTDQVGGYWRDKRSQVGIFPAPARQPETLGLPFYDRIQRGRPRHQPIERFGELNSMMTWAEAAAKKEGISREEADQWALGSHVKAIRAMDAGKFAEEITAVSVKQRGGGTSPLTGMKPPAGRRHWKNWPSLKRSILMAYARQGILPVRTMLRQHWFVQPRRLPRVTASTPWYILGLSAWLARTRPLPTRRFL